MRKMLRVEKEILEKRLDEVKGTLKHIAKQREELFEMETVISGMAYASAVEIMVKQSTKLRAEKHIIETKLELISNDFEDDVQKSLSLDYIRLRNELKDLIKEINSGVYTGKMITRRDTLEKKVAELKKVINTEYFESICKEDKETRNKTPEEEMTEEINKILSAQCGFNVNINPDDIQVVNSFDDLMNIINKGNETGCKSDSERKTANEQIKELLNMLGVDGEIVPLVLGTRSKLDDFEGDTLSKTPIKFNESPSWTDIKSTPVEDTEDCVSDKFIEAGVKLMEKMIKDDPGFRSLIAQMSKEYDNRK